MPGVKTNERPGTRAVLRHAGMSAFKAREVLDLIRGVDYLRAAEILESSERGAAVPVGKLLRSAASNAFHNDQLDPEELYVSACFADEGTTMKRWRPRARGRATRIRKRTCHITVILSRMPEDQIARRRAHQAAEQAERRARRVAGTRRASRQQADVKAELAAEEAAERAAIEAAEAEAAAAAAEAEAAEAEEEGGVEKDTTAEADEQGEAAEETTDEAPTDEAKAAETGDDEASEPVANHEVEAAASKEASSQENPDEEQK
jgi:large subunit ribosomal protein L22